jgi:hypothetical protein
MGCWNETCAITTLPILEGDECVMSVFSADPNDAWALSGDMSGFFHRKCIWGIFKGRYNDYGWLEGVDEPDNVNEMVTYKDDISGKETETMVNLCDYPRSFVHKEAWDWAIKFAEKDKYFMKYLKEEMSDKDAPKIKSEVPVDLMIEYRKVRSTCFQLRRTMFAGTEFSGSQMDDPKPYKGMMKVTKSLVNKLAERRAEWA